MRLFARPRDPRCRGSVHALRAAYNDFTLVEPFPNGKLYFRRIVDRPVCVYVIDDRLFVLASVLQAFVVVPVGGRRFQLESVGGVFSPGDYLDCHTCLPTADWPDAKAWESFAIAPPPPLDQRERETIACIDSQIARPPTDVSLGADPIETAVRACLTVTGRSRSAPTGVIAGLVRRARATRRGPVDATGGFNGHVEICDASHAAGWAARGREPTIVTVYLNERRIGEAQPAGERPDVAAAGHARLSAWSFAFPRALTGADRLAFRFADGSPLRALETSPAREHRHRFGSRDPYYRGSVHSLRAAYNDFTLVEPSASGELYFRPVVDRPVCVYLVGNRLFILASVLQAFVVVPTGGGRFQLESLGGVFSPGDFVDSHSCVPTAHWPEAKAWETFSIAPPPPLDRRDRETIACIDRLIARPRNDALSASPGADSLETAVRACLTATGPSSIAPTDAITDLVRPPWMSAPDPIDATIGTTHGFAGYVEVCETSHAAGWAARGRAPTVVTIYLNDIRIGEAQPAGERPDVAEAGYARLSSWSFAFPRALTSADRLAFRFADGSPLRVREGLPRLGTVHVLRSTYNGFTLCKSPGGGGLRFERRPGWPLRVYVVDDKLFFLDTPVRAFVVEAKATTLFHLRDPNANRLFSLGRYHEDDTFAPECDRIAALDWERFELGAPPDLAEDEVLRIALIDRTLTPHGSQSGKVSTDIVDACRSLAAYRPRKREVLIRTKARPARVGLCAIARNEGPYLVEWIAYHLALGFDHIVIYDNESTDQGFATVTRAGFHPEELTVKPWPSINGSAQAAAYDDFFETAASSYDWVMILDLDEFLVLKNKPDVKDFLVDFYAADGVAINWKIFGSAGQSTYQPGFLLERFTRASAIGFGPNANIKSFFRPSCVGRASTHSPFFYEDTIFVDQINRPIETSGQANLIWYDVNHDNAQINHYFTKSREEFERKRRRGKADHEHGNPEKYRLVEEFDIYDQNQEKDEVVLQTIAYNKFVRRIRNQSLDLLTCEAFYLSNKTSNQQQLQPRLLIASGGLLIGWQPAYLGNALSCLANMFLLSSKCRIPAVYTFHKPFERAFETTDIWIVDPASEIDRSRLDAFLAENSSLFDSDPAQAIGQFKGFAFEDLAKRETRGEIVFTESRQELVDWRDDSADELAGRYCQKGNGLVVSGCYWRQYLDMRELSEAGIRLRHHLGPLRQESRAARRQRAALEKTSKILRIGVHFRIRSDYSIWLEGIYHFSPEHTLSIMRRLHLELGTRQHTFYIFSDCDLNPSLFDELPIYMEPAEYIDDFIAMSNCDLIIGPPSTFASWAAFLGNAKRIVLTKERIGDTTADVLPMAINIPFPNGHYLPGDATGRLI